MLLSMSKIKVKVEVDPQRLQPSDVPVLLSDCTKLKELTGWQPKIPIRQSLEDLLNGWREGV
jgi:GDP-4-dehydro-6-deoxy-D-mannose reductase